MKRCEPRQVTSVTAFRTGLPFKRHAKFPKSQKHNHSGKPRSKGMSLAILRKTRPIASNCHQIFSANSALGKGFRRARGGRTLLPAVLDFAQPSDMKFRKPKTSKSGAQGTSRGSLALAISRLLFMRMFMQCRDPVKVY
jgi:hypothetical protein